MSKTTVVSIFPRDIDERKPGISPGHFTIPKAREGDFELIYLGDSFYWVTFEDQKPPLKMVSDSQEIANSLINDFVRNIPGYNPTANAMPGLFSIPGHPSKGEILAKYRKELEEARIRQRNWYEKVVYEADDLWMRFRQHRMISSLQRFACKSLGLEREWSVDIPVDIPKVTLCPACQEKVSPVAVICGHCSCVLDEEKYKKMKFAGKESVGK